MEENITQKLSSLSEISKLQLSKILNLFPTSKDLTLEPSIIRPLERICGVQWLKAHGVHKIYKLESIASNLTEEIHFYMIYANVATFKHVVSLICAKLDPENPEKNKFHIVLVPDCSQIFYELLEELGLIDSIIKLYSFHWQPIHLDSGIVSLEFPYVYKYLYLHKDSSVLSAISKSLWHLFLVTGKPKCAVALGKYAVAALKQLDCFCEQMGESDKVDTDFNGLVLLDRNIDYISALLTPVTYSALLCEVYNVSSGICEHGSVKVQKYDSKYNPVVKKEPVKFILNSKIDPVYKDIKNCYFTEVINLLRTLAKELRSEGQNSKEMALDAIKKYVATQLQATASKKKYLTNHLIAAETVVKVIGPRIENQRHIEQSILCNKNKNDNFTYLKEIIMTQNDIFVCLRLICLIAATQKFTENEIKDIWNKFLLEYGYQYGFVYNLIKTNFLIETVNYPSLKFPKLNSNNFYINANRMKQIPNNRDSVNFKSPTCCSYVFGGIYIPLITQIASMLLNDISADEIKTKLQPFGPLTIKNVDGYASRPKALLLCVIGGVTYAEIAACNLLEDLTGSKIFICSDQLTSGNHIMENLSNF